MNQLLILIGFLGFGALGLWAFTTTNPATLARLGRNIVPILVGLIGILTTLSGRIAMGLPIIGFAVALFARNRNVARSAPSANQRSVVRTAMLEMELDHDTGQMNGVVLAGTHEGAVLDELDEVGLRSLAREVAQDRESAELLEAYFDRRMPGWRDGMETDSGAGQGAARQSGAMTHEEAYQVLGLEPGATAVEIRKAHRRLMQGVHPDVGGSSFLAARINEAKDLLLSAHKQ